MLKNIRIRHFKTLKDLQIKDFARINLFVGQPNSGKTSILEALAIFCSHPKDNLIPKLLQYREMMLDDDCFRELFYDHQIQEKIDLSGQIDAQNLSLGLRYDETSSTNFDLEHRRFAREGADRLMFEYQDGSMQILEGFVERFNSMGSSRVRFGIEGRKFDDNSLNLFSSKINILKVGATSFIHNGNFEQETSANLKQIFEDKTKKKNFEQKYQQFSDEIEEIFFSGEKIAVQTKGLDKAVNLKSMGQGFQKYIYIQSAICEGKKYVMIDEIENGLHFESIDLLIDAILEAKEIQFFITTHNQELLHKISQKVRDYQNALATFNVYKDKDHIVQVGQYSQEDFVFNIEQNNEVRD